MSACYIDVDFYAIVTRRYVFGLSINRVRRLARSYRQILLPRYRMNGLSNLNETYSEYSLAPTDNLIRFWRSRSQQAVEVAKASTSTLVETIF